MNRFGAVVTAGMALSMASCSNFEARTEQPVDWLTVVNGYRAQSGLDPVTHNPAWDAGTEAHSCYMLKNGIGHFEKPSNPGYTELGEDAGAKSNVGISTDADDTAKDFIDLWMTGPFHAVGLLRPSLEEVALGICKQGDSSTMWHSAATLDVISGIDSQLVQTEPVLFPGDQVTIDLHEFIIETPNPVEMCGWQGQAGLPLIAMFPEKVTSAEATLSGPSGDLEVCVLDPGEELGDPTAEVLLDANNVVIVIPKLPLSNGSYHTSIVTDNQNAEWTFRVVA